MIGTLKNDTSSRSHFICSIRLVDRETRKASDIKLIDLAGSERNSDTKNHTPERIKESVYINTSLMALKNCIRQRSSANLKDGERVPFRSSKLTLLLKDVLDPSTSRPTRLVMVATLAPTIHDVAHSLDTFRYAAALKSMPIIKEGRPSLTSSSPMAWSLSRLDNWIKSQTNGVVTLEKLVLEDLVPKSADEFIMPAWKHIYELPETVWIKRCAPLPVDATKSLRLAYRTLFVKKRPSTKSTEIGSNYEVETLLLAEIHRPKSVSTKSRNDLAMEKLAERGRAARQKLQSRSLGGSTFSFK
jgi:hypothetical protein